MLLAFSIFPSDTLPGHHRRLVFGASAPAVKSKGHGDARCVLAELATAVNASECILTTNTTLPSALTRHRYTCAVEASGPSRWRC